MFHVALEFRFHVIVRVLHGCNSRSFKGNGLDLASKAKKKKKRKKREV
jgi:hypothetical protein